MKPGDSRPLPPVENPERRTTEELFPLVYEELRRLAAQKLAQEPLVGFLGSSRRDQQAEAIHWKERQHTWGFLQGLLEGQGKK